MAQKKEDEGKAVSLENEKSMTELGKHFSNVTFVAPKSEEEFFQHWNSFWRISYNFAQKNFPETLKMNYDDI